MGNRSGLLATNVSTTFVFAVSLAFGLGLGLGLGGCSAQTSEDGAAADSAYSASASADAATQMRAIVATAKTAAADQSPGGHCYAAVARYIDTSGYGKMRAQPASAVGSLPSIPAAYGTYAHQFADYANLPGKADALGLTRLALHSPYDAPAGAIVVVRAGTPGTSNPTAGDISIAAGDGAFYNDGAMSYGGRASFPAGNDFVLGIYVPKGAADTGGGATCNADRDCNHGAAHTVRVCGNDGVCIGGCHEDSDCATGKSCSHDSAQWSCR